MTDADLQKALVEAKEFKKMRSNEIEAEVERAQKQMSFFQNQLADWQRQIPAAVMEVMADEVRNKVIQEQHRLEEPTRSSLTDEQLNDVLKNIKKKGAERVFSFLFFASFPLALLIALFGLNSRPDQIVMACAGWYLAVAGFAVFSI